MFRVDGFRFGADIMRRGSDAALRYLSGQGSSRRAKWIPRGRETGTDKNVCAT
jgi:hypothetical protein